MKDNSRAGKRSFMMDDILGGGGCYGKDSINDMRTQVIQHHQDNNNHTQERILQTSPMSKKLGIEIRHNDGSERIDCDDDVFDCKYTFYVSVNIGRVPLFSFKL